jgi:hypothetical protein
MIAALYVERGGVYFGLPDVDPWDAERDARLYAGPWPVVAHPPCQRWSQLAPWVAARGGAPVGKDSGTFAAALGAVRRWGGVLEHPANTLAWARHGLTDPPRGGGWARCFDGGWVCQVEQGHYGHAAPKPTWLYAFGVIPPVLAWGPSGATGRIEAMWSKDPRRAGTPVPFRDLLLDMARSARPP